MVPEHGDPGVLEQAVLHDLFRPQPVAAMDAASQMKLAKASLPAGV
jgi:hypothetical protein